MIRRIAATIAATIALSVAAAVVVAPLPARAVIFWQWNGPHPTHAECEEVRDGAPHTGPCVYRALPFDSGWYFKEPI